MIDDLIVCVGRGIAPRGPTLLAALMEEGFDARLVYDQWPRDKFVFLNNRYILPHTPGVGGYGEGGCVLPGDGFVLASAMLGCGWGDSYLGRSKKHLATVYPEVRSYLLPWLPSEKTEHAFHIDVSSLLLPKKRVLILDSYLGGPAGSPDSLDSIAKRERLDVVMYDGCHDFTFESATFPLNALVLEDRKGRDVVFIDSKAKRLARLLKSLAVRCVPVDVPFAETDGGSIRCSTNEVLASDWGKYLSPENKDLY